MANYQFLKTKNRCSTTRFNFVTHCACLRKQCAIKKRYHWLRILWGKSRVITIFNAVHEHIGYYISKLIFNVFAKFV